MAEEFNDGNFGAQNKKKQATGFAQYSFMY